MKFTLTASQIISVLDALELATDYAQDHVHRTPKEMTGFGDTFKAMRDQQHARYQEQQAPTLDEPELPEYLRTECRHCGATFMEPYYLSVHHSMSLDCGSRQHNFLKDRD